MGSRREATRDRQARRQARHLRLGKVGTRIANTLFLLVALGAGVIFTFAAVGALAAGSQGISVSTVLLLGFLLADALVCLAIVVFDYVLKAPWVRLVARAAVVIVVGALLADLLNSGVHALQLFYVLQLVLILAVLASTDRDLRAGRRLREPWDRSEDPSRRHYIPLNFFNLFWVFTVASAAGLLIELLWHLLLTGEYQDRAGMLWGPFSPIYGFGALLMTVALNRWWNRSKLIIFLVSGVIGAAFEFTVSWWMEHSFGIVAWDYSGTFLNIDGRTNFAFFCAWGFLGLVWIRLLLPDVLRLVDMVPVRWRILLTIFVAMFMLVDGVMTLLVLDRWYERTSGAEATTAVETYVDAHFDDSFMEHRFQTMDLDANRVDR